MDMEINIWLWAWQKKKKMNEEKFNTKKTVFREKNLGILPFDVWIGIIKKKRI